MTAKFIGSLSEIFAVSGGRIIFMVLFAYETRKYYEIFEESAHSKAYCDFYSGSRIIHGESGKVIGVVSYIMAISGELSPGINRTSNAKNFSMRFFLHTGWTP